MTILTSNFFRTYASEMDDEKLEFVDSLTVQPKKQKSKTPKEISVSDLIKKLEQKTSVVEAPDLYLTVAKWFLLDSLSTKSRALGLRDITQRTNRIFRRVNALGKIRFFVLVIEFKSGKENGQPFLYLFVCASFNQSPAQNGLRGLISERECSFYQSRNGVVIRTFFNSLGERSIGVEQMLDTDGVWRVEMDEVSFRDKKKKGTFKSLFAFEPQLDKDGVPIIEPVITNFLQYHYFLHIFVS